MNVSQKDYDALVGVIYDAEQYNKSLPYDTSKPEADIAQVKRLMEKMLKQLSAQDRRKK